MKKLILLLFIPLVSFGQEDINNPNTVAYENILKSIVELREDIEIKINSLGASREDYEKYDELKIERDKLDSEIMRYINKIIEIDESNDFVNQIKSDIQKEKKENDIRKKAGEQYLEIMDKFNTSSDSIIKEWLKKTSDERRMNLLEDVSSAAMQFRINEKSLSTEEKEFRTGQINSWIKALESDVGLVEDGMKNLETLNENNNTIVYQMELINKQLYENYNKYDKKSAKEMMVNSSPNNLSTVCEKRQIIVKYRYFYNGEVFLEVKIYPNEWND